MTDKTVVGIITATTANAMSFVLDEIPEMNLLRIQQKVYNRVLGEMTPKPLHVVKNCKG